VDAQMSRLEFDRNDLSVRVRPESENLLLEYKTRGGKLWTQTTTVSDIQSGVPLEPPASAVQEGSSTVSGLMIRRLCLDIEDGELAALPWETVFRHLGPVVRVSLVKPVLGVEPLKLPLRVMQVGSAQPPSLAALVYGLFGTRTQAEIHQAV